MPIRWAIDLGTTNSVVARWDDTDDQPVIVDLGDICRPRDASTVEAPALVPSATHLLPPRDLWDQLGRTRFLEPRVFWGNLAWIGQRALDENAARATPSFVPTWKPWLGRASLRTLARVGEKPVSARDVAHAFLRELLVRIRDVSGERVRELMLTAPVDAYETYRAELLRIAARLGVHTVRFVDEPVAAALGYGLAGTRRRNVLVVDFGGGTLHLALVRIDPREAEHGGCTVVAKAGRAIGGNVVDGWILEEVAQRVDMRLPKEGTTEESFWYRLMLAEAQRVKEAVFFTESETFLMSPPEGTRGLSALRRGDQTTSLSRDDLVGVLERNGAYLTLRELTDEVMAHARAQGVQESEIDDVLMVGGSTLLPNVYPLFEERFGRDRVRAWQPFEAVAHGAAALGGRGVEQSDFIVHDYAIVTYDRTTNERQYTTIVPRGTRFPTAPDLWRQQLVPTCALGEPETLFKLVICEVGSGDARARTFAWDESGALHKLGGQGADAARVVVPLNEANPTLGSLDPPHPPSDKSPRLDVMFGVDAQRWLVATVRDLKTSRVLLSRTPVVRLL
jgi:molecular chaperone DnaK (HSP70)